MNSLSDDDEEFGRQFDSGGVMPAQFDHRAHLRLAYVHLAVHGPEHAVHTFRHSLQGFLQRHRIDPAKFHETLTQAWLSAVWYFMQRFGDTSSSEDFLGKSAALHDPKVMLTHYSKEVLFSDDARREFVAPDLDPIPAGVRSAAPRHEPR